jgi:hypothetical protein
LGYCQNLGSEHLSIESEEMKSGIVARVMQQ